MTIIASCHCGGTRIELPEAPAEATQCTCTFCTKSGAQWAYYEMGQPRVLSDMHGAVYSPTTPLHEHHFCAKCGCATYGISPNYTLESDGIPEDKKWAVNVRLFDDYGVFRGLKVGEIDGRNLW